MNALSHFFQEAVHKLAQDLRAVEKAVAKPLIWVSDAFRDVAAAVAHRGALPVKRRSIDEVQLVLGTAAVVAGTIELNPLAAAGGAVTAFKAEEDLRTAGHRWRAQHEKHAAHHHPHHR